MLFLGCGPALHDVETTRRCIVASLRPEMSEAAALTSRCALKCLTQRAVRRVSGWHLWRVGLALVTCWVGTCGGPCGVSGLSVWLVAGRAACRGFLCGLWRAVRRVGAFCVACGGPCGVSNFVESWIFLSICEKKPINGRIRGAKYVEFCRKVSKVGFFSGCRKKSQEKRYFKYIFLAFFETMAVLSNSGQKATSNIAVRRQRALASSRSFWI